MTKNKIENALYKVLFKLIENTLRAYQIKNCGIAVFDIRTDMGQVVTCIELTSIAKIEERIVDIFPSKLITNLRNHGLSIPFCINIINHIEE